MVIGKTLPSHKLPTLLPWHQQETAVYNSARFERMNDSLVLLSKKDLQIISEKSIPAISRFYNLQNTSLSFLKNLCINTNKLKIWHQLFQFSAHLSCFTEESKVTLKLRGNTGFIRKGKLVIENKSIFSPHNLLGSLCKLLIFPFRTICDTNTITETCNTIILTLL